MHEDIDVLNPEEIKSRVKDINSLSKYAHNLLVNLLNWASLQSGELEYNPAMTNLYELSEETLDYYRKKAEKKKIKFNNEIDKDTRVYGDANMLATVFRNLVSNALKFTPKKGEIHIRSYNEDDKIKVEVKDTGLGIPGDIIDNVFNIGAGYGDSSHDKKAGLGLIICKEFIDMHDGKIWIESKEKQGTSIYFTLPVKT